MAQTKYGTLNISGYMLARYMNQMSPSQTYYDHLDNAHVTDGRNDILWHRVQAFITGWVYNPKLTYNITFWTVNATNQVAWAHLRIIIAYRFMVIIDLTPCRTIR